MQYSGVFVVFVYPVLDTNHRLGENAALCNVVLDTAVLLHAYINHRHRENVVLCRALVYSSLANRQASLIPRLLLLCHCTENNLTVSMYSSRLAVEFL